MAAQGVALRAGHARRQRGVPVGKQIGTQRGAVEVPAAEQHQVGLERVVDQLDMLALPCPQALLQARGDARQQGLAQRALVAVAGRGEQHLAAVQADRARTALQGIGRWRVGPLRPEGREGVEWRQQGRQVGGGRARGAHHRAFEHRQLLVERRDALARVGIGLPRQQARGRRGANAQARQAARDQRALAAPAQIRAGQPRLGEDHVAQQPRHEKGLAARVRGRQGAALQTQRAHQAAERAVHRRALLRGAGEVDAAHAWLELGTQLAEHRLQELEQRLAQDWPLLRKGEDGGAARPVVLAAQLVEQALVQALFERAEVARQARARAVARRIVAVGEGDAPDLRALVLVEVGEELHEAREQVELGHQHVDRKGDAELGVQLLDALAQRRGMRARLHRAGAKQIARAQGQQHAVDRPPRPMAQQQVEKAEPGRAVGRVIAVVRAVAAGGVEQHRLAGEPPVAVARAAHALHHRGTEGAREREVEPGVDQGGGLAGARRADQDVPGQLIERGPAAERAEPGRPAPSATATQARAAQRRHGLLEAL